MRNGPRGGVLRRSAPAGGGVNLPPGVPQVRGSAAKAAAGSAARGHVGVAGELDQDHRLPRLLLARKVKLLERVAPALRRVLRQVRRGDAGDDGRAGGVLCDIYVHDPGG